MHIITCPALRGASPETCRGRSSGEGRGRRCGLVVSPDEAGKPVSSMRRPRPGLVSRTREAPSQPSAGITTGCPRAGLHVCDDERAVATAPDKGRHGLSPTGSTAPRGQKTPQVERREAPSSDRKEEGDASQASRAASPAAQGVSQTPASAGAPLPSGERDEDGSDGVPGAGQRTRAMNRVWIVGWAKARFRAPCPPAERPRGAHAALCAPYDVWDDASALACFPPPKVRYRSREVGGGRATRQPGQVRKEAALTSPVRVVVSLPPNSTPRRQSRAEH